MDLLVENVDKGIMSVDEARAAYGLPPLTPEIKGIAKAAVLGTPVQGELLEAKSVDADVIKSAVSDAVKPFLDQLNAQNKQDRRT